MKAIPEHLLSLVRKPARYTGGEWNSLRKDPAAATIRWALCFPDIYDVGMSHLGLRILYHILNGQEGVLCERAFLPWPDYAGLLRKHEATLSSLENAIPLADFDILGFSIGYELAYPSVLQMLELGGVPLRSDARGDLDPLVIAGGPCMLNPEPMAPFLDAVVIGDGEEVVLEITDAVRELKRSGASRASLLSALAAIDGVYVPSLYDAEYQDGHFAGLRPKQGAPERISRRIVADLSAVPFPVDQIVPFVETVHERAVIEIMRGCTQGCRFCHAGMTCRPVRERPAADCVAMARAAIDSTGFDEVGLLSLSSMDHSEIHELVDGIVAEFEGESVGISMPSQRVDAFSVALSGKISAVRKSGVTLAPEAGTQRLRDVINKRVTDEDIMAAVSAAFESGHHVIKCYFMIGLPTETDDDILGIADVLEQIRRASSVAGAKRRGALVNVSLATFVPKPHTPFQWERQISIEETRARQELLMGRLGRSKHYNLRRHDARESQVEGFLTRGDRRLSDVVEWIAERSVGPQAWQEFFDFSLWEAALTATGLSGPDLTAERDESGPLPWEHVECGPRRSFLLAERHRALAGEHTPDCRVAGCQNCGEMCSAMRGGQPS